MPQPSSDLFYPVGKHSSLTEPPPNEVYRKTSGPYMQDQSHAALPTQVKAAVVLTAPEEMFSTHPAHLLKTCSTPRFNPRKAQMENPDLLPASTPILGGGGFPEEEGIQAHPLQNVASFLRENNLLSQQGPPVGSMNETLGREGARASCSGPTSWKGLNSLPLRSWTGENWLRLPPE